MHTYEVAETFISINGESTRAGELAVFLRFKGCNLACEYCDTKWANVPDALSRTMSTEEIVSYVQESGVRNVTLTGGEPLMREGMEELIEALLSLPGIRVEIETNGSIDLTTYASLEKRPSFTMDYKLPCSGMESRMCLSNFALLEHGDTVKFVVGSIADMERAEEIMREYELIGRTHLYYSPVFGQIDPKDMVEYLTAHRLNDVRIQLQLHKFIWDPNARGV